MSTPHDHTQTHYTRCDSSGRGTGAQQRPIPTQHTTLTTDRHAPDGIRTPNPRPTPYIALPLDLADFVCRIIILCDSCHLPLSCRLFDAGFLLDTGFSLFLCVYKQMLRWFPTFQVATTCFSCRSPDLNLVVTNFIFCIHVK